MQRCTDCGYSNRSGVHYCTHCGKAVAASTSSIGGPTTLVAAAVLAIGLLAFLTIRPVASTQSPEETASPPLSALHGAVAADEGSLPPVEGVELTSGEDAVNPVREPDEAASATMAPDVGMDEAGMPGDVVNETAATNDAVHGAKAPEEVVHGASALENAPVVAGGATAQATPGLDPSLASVDVIDTRASELMTPAASTPASSLVPQVAPTPVEPGRVRHAADGDRPSAHSPARRPAQHLPEASSSVHKRAAVERSSTRSDVAPVRTKARDSWRTQLRSEIEACDGNFIVRTVCVERAKLRHCTPANAWGDVPECPVPPMPELATFN